MCNSFRIFIYSFFLSFLILCCTPKKEAAVTKIPSYDTLQTIGNGDAVISDRQLSQAVCGSCHLFPEPELLNKRNWRKVLPQMGHRLGFTTLQNHPYSSLSPEELEVVIKTKMFPRAPVLDSAVWRRIVFFYESEAPEKPLIQDNKLPVKNELSGFTVVDKHLGFVEPPLITLLEFDSADHIWFIGDRRNNLYRLNNDFQLLDSLTLDSPPADIEMGERNKAFVVLMGEMDPNDKLAGKVVGFNKSEPLNPNSINKVLEHLARPVHMSAVDLNNDGYKDKIICEFGSLTGKLSWYENLKTGEYNEHVLKSAPGAIKTVTEDIDADGLQDIIALMTQGDEGIFLFKNLGKGKFKEVPLLRFQPVYGSSDFELIDFNKDGYLDILYANGDNADFSFSLKKYHGIRLFINNGKNDFKQVWFYPLHGATKALARDFDQDGDFDIAAIAFFPDYAEAPEEGFVYFENTGNLNFNPLTFANSEKGRWLIMEAGDFDQDNDLDIALGSFIFSPTPVPAEYRKLWINKGPDVVILENKKY